jgi:hypothetical protein
MACEVPPPPALRLGVHGAYGAHNLHAQMQLEGTVPASWANRNMAMD